MPCRPVQDPDSRSNVTSVQTHLSARDQPAQVKQLLLAGGARGALLLCDVLLQRHGGARRRLPLLGTSCKVWCSRASVSGPTQQHHYEYGTPDIAQTRTPETCVIMPEMTHGLAEGPPPAARGCHAAHPRPGAEQEARHPVRRRLLRARRRAPALLSTWCSPAQHVALASHEHFLAHGGSAVSRASSCYTFQEIRCIPAHS